MTSPATSADPDLAALLATERHLTCHYPHAQDAPWLRMLFPSDRQHWKPDIHTWAFTTDDQDLVVREFRCSQRSLHAYAALVTQFDGNHGPAPSCPVEAVLPCSIAVARPAIAAHRTIRAIAQWLGYS